jgi:hypothetical protein
MGAMKLLEPQTESLIIYIYYNLLIVKNSIKEEIADGITPF